MMVPSANKRVAITGMAVISPLGNTLPRFWGGLLQGRSGISSVESTVLSGLFAAAGLATEFTGAIEDFGPLDHDRKRAIRKGLKLMCREIQMGVAVAQQAMHHAGLVEFDYDPDRAGVVFGCDHIVTVPEEFARAVSACQDHAGFQFERWGQHGLSEIAPLWLLKYLPNMPASHIAIYNDLRGANNSLIYREASSNLALGEGMESIIRGKIDRAVVGATGSSVNPYRAVQLAMSLPWAQNGVSARQLCRPFDVHRTGMVPGEGAGAVILEEFRAAETRGATIYGELLGHGSSMVVDRDGVARIPAAVANAIKAALRRAGLRPEQIGHVHAHGVATTGGDIAEAQGIAATLGNRVPVTTAKGALGNLGAAGGCVELIASLLAIRHQKLFAIQNCEQLDPECPISAVMHPGVSPGSIVISVSFTPHGQATAVIARGYAGSAPG